MTGEAKQTHVEPTLCAQCRALLPDDVAEALRLEEFRLELGEGLLSLAAALPNRVKSLRVSLASELGFPFPSLNIVDNPRLAPDSYRLLRRGAPLAGGHLRADGLMVVDPSGAPPAIEGEPGVDPAFGIPVAWVNASERARAEARGFQVVEPATVLLTHLEEVVRVHAHALLSVETAAALLEQCRALHPRLVAEVVPALVPLVTWTEVLRGLLQAQVPVRDLASLLEALASAPAEEREPAALVERARRKLSRPGEAAPA
jgi:flagellar biosynthesis protein FlhA